MTNLTTDLAAALEPFAKVAETRVNMNGAPHVPDDGDVLPAGPLTWGDVRRAQAALARAKGTWPAEREVGQAVYERIEKLIDAKPDTPEGVELAYLSHLVESVEEVGGYDGPEQPLARAKGGEPDADGWIEWRGGENPVPGKLVEWRNRRGDRSLYLADYLGGWEHPHESGSEYDIIAYRLAALQEPGPASAEEPS